MNTPVTFFRNREDQGETYTFEARTPKHLVHVFVYSQKPVEASSLCDQERSSWDDYRRVIRGLRDVIATQGGGGVIVEIAGDAKLLSAKITPAGDQGAPIEHFDMLRAGYPPTLKPISAEWLDLPPSSHLIVPVDREMEGQLRAFQEQLGFLSADLELLIVNAIRRPSLDARLGRVEAHLFGHGAESSRGMEGRGWLGRQVSRLYGLRQRTAVRWLPAVFLLGAFLASNAILIYKVDKLTASPAKPTLAPTPAPTPTTAGPTPPKPPLPQVKDNNLFAVLKSKKNTKVSLQLLYDNHFAQFEQKLFDDRVSSLFAPTPDNHSFLLGLVKLEALKLHGEPVNLEFLRKIDNITATKQVFEELGPGALEKDASARDLLTFLACRLYGMPGLPDTTQYRGTAAFIFVQDKSCAAFGPKVAKPDMKDLLDFVNRE